nr:PREDICTED: facilitated trehalose transporter Tret1-like isoform X1 [Bemisia tabaci]
MAPQDTLFGSGEKKKEYDDSVDEVKSLDLETSDSEQSVNMDNMRTALPQVLATLAQSLLLLSLGMIIAVPTIVIGAIYKAKEGLSLDDDQSSWFCSILLIVQPIGSLLSGYVQEVVGRKISLVVVNIPQLVGWYLMYAATTVDMLYWSCVTLGFSIGFMEAPTLAYVGEISQPRLRGMLSCITNSHVPLGHLVEFFIGGYVAKDWRMAMAISAVFPIISILAISQVPESPVWLLTKGRKADAMKALCWLRGWTTPECVRDEFEGLVRYVEASRLQNENQQKAAGKNYVQVPTAGYVNADGKGTTPAKVPAENNYKFKVTIGEKIKDLLRPAMLRPLVLVVSYFFFYNCASLNAIRPYMVPVFQKLRLPKDPHFVAILSAALQVLGGLVCIATVHKLGKRCLSLISMTLCAVACILIGIYAVLIERTDFDCPWFPFIVLLALYFCCNVGISPIPWMLISEVFPSRGRGAGGGVSAALFYIILSIISKTYLDLESIVTFPGVFFVYGLVACAGVIFIFLCLPETEGKTLQEIEDYFTRSRKKGINNLSV